MKTPQVDIEKEVDVLADEDIKGRTLLVWPERCLINTVDPKLLSATLRLACERSIEAEPDLTKWDMIMGDGDCGEAVKGVSKGRLPRNCHWQR